MDKELLKYTENPQLLIDILSAVIKQIKNSSKSEDFKRKNIQLIEINKAIKSIEKKNVTVPDSLRLEKSKLISELSSLSSQPKINVIKNELEKIFSDMCWEVPKLKNVKKATRSKTPKTDFKTLRNILIEVLKEAGGRSKVKHIKLSMEKKLKNSLLPGDNELRSDGKTVIWFNNVQWERMRMIKEGILKQNSQRGIWELAGDNK